MKNSQILGRYNIIRQIGTGGVGEVFYAYDTFQKKHVAIKKIRQELSGFIKNDILQYEFKIISKIKDPYLISVYDFFMLPYNIDSFFTMEYIDGTVYDRLIPSIPLRDHILIALKVSRALNTLHQQGILHLDIKSSNIMVRESNGEPVLMDFGLSRERGNTAMFFMQGTLNYMAPEIAEQKDIDIYTDIYSLGILFYKIFTKRFPYSVSRHADISGLSKNRQYKEPLQLNSNIPDPLNNLILDMIEYEPQKRPKSIDPVLRTLISLIGRNQNEIIKQNTSSYLFYSRTIGREKELQKTKSAITDPSANLLNIINVRGQRGIGKSHFLKDIKFFLQSRGFFVISTNCIKSLEGSYYVIVDLLMKLRNLVDYLLLPMGKTDLPSGHEKPSNIDDSTIFVNSILETQEILEKKAPFSFREDLNPKRLQELSLKIKNAELQYREPATIRSSMDIIYPRSIKELFYRSFDILREASEIIKIAIIIEDLSFDKSIQSFAGYLNSYLDNTRIPDLLILISDGSDSLHIFKPDNNTKSLTINLKAFGVEETQLFASTMLGYKIDQRFGKLIFRFTKGNPDQIQEFLRFLFNKRCIAWNESRWEIRKIPDLKQYDMKHIVVENLKHLNKNQLNIVAILAIAGIPLMQEILEKCFNKAAGLIEELDLLERLRIIESRYLITGHKSYSLSFYDYSTHLMSILTDSEYENLIQNLSYKMVDYYFKSGNYSEVISLLCYKSGLFPWSYVFSKHTAVRLIDTFSYKEALRHLNLSIYSLTAAKHQKPENHDRRLHKLYTLYMSLFHKTNNREMVFVYLKKSLRLAYKTKSRYKLCDNLIFRFNYYVMKRDYKKACISQKKAIPVSMHMNLEKYVKVLGNYAITFYYLKDMANYIKAMKKLEKPLIKLGNKKMSGIFYINMGVYFRTQYELDKAYKNYEKALAIAEETGSPYLFSLCYGNLSTCYFYKKDFEKAVNFQNISLAYSKAISDLSGMVYSTGLLLIYLFFAMMYSKIEEQFLLMISDIRKYNIQIEIYRLAESHVLYLLSLYNTMNLTGLFSCSSKIRLSDTDDRVKNTVIFNRQLALLYYNLFILYSRSRTASSLAVLRSKMNYLELNNITGSFETEEFRKIFNIIEIFCRYIENFDTREENKIIKLIRDLNADIHYNPIFIFNKTMLIINIAFLKLIRYRKDAPDKSISACIDLLVSESFYISKPLALFFLSCYKIQAGIETGSNIHSLISSYKELKHMENKYQFLVACLLCKRILSVRPSYFSDEESSRISEDIKSIENQIIVQLPEQHRTSFNRIFTSQQQSLFL